MLKKSIKNTIGDSMNSLSIILPVYNEVAIIGKLLQHLQTYAEDIESIEIIVVDCGSVDGTLEEIAKYPDVICLSSDKGRAIQMNTGAARASAPILYFLHADSFPPKGYDTYIIKEYQSGYKAGCFRIKFDHSHFLLVSSAWFTRFNILSCRGGDQSLFVDKELFEFLGGFDPQFIICEDMEFIKKLYRNTSFRVIPKYLVTSARRYVEKGIWRLQFHFMVIHLKKWWGTSPKKLWHYYKKYVL